MRIKDDVKIFIILLFLLFLSIFLTINTSPVYYWLAIIHFHLNHISDLSSTSLMKCYFFMLKYLQVPWDCHLNLVFFRSSTRGLMHFKDVRHLVMLNNFCLMVFGGLSLNIINRWHSSDNLWRLINPLKAFLAGGLVLVGIAMINFQAFFINFHRVMFRNNDWVFNANLDPVIKVLPTAFFAWCFLAFIVVITMLLGLLLYKSE